MLDRRQFLMSAAVASGAAGRDNFGRYDLVIRGGRLVDPTARLDATGDVAIANGRIAAVAPRIDARGAQLFDASGKIVAPGLIDVHTHCGQAADSASIVLRNGVTGWVDAGSAGADNVDQSAAIARAAPQKARILVNIARTGLTAAGELKDLGAARVDLAMAAIARHRDVIVGVKARLSDNVAGANDLEGLRRAQKAASAFGLPVMIHIGQSYSPLPAILALLKRGDVVTHMYAPAPHGILDDQGRLFPEVRSARQRGVLFDFGHGSHGHFSWEVVEAATKQEFWPDTISTDWTASNLLQLPDVMSKLLAAGLSLGEVFRCVTTAAARVFPGFAGAGTLRPGASADVTILNLKIGNFDFKDNYGDIRVGHQILSPVATILAGNVAAAYRKT